MNFLNKHKYLIAILLIALLTLLFSYVRAIEITPNELTQMLGEQNVGATICYPYQGCTGTSTVPTADQMLIGGDNSRYDVKTLTAGTNVTIATSSGLITISSTASGGGGGGSGYWATSTEDWLMYNIDGADTNPYTVLIQNDGTTATTTDGKIFEVVGDSEFDQASTTQLTTTDLFLDGALYDVNGSVGALGEILSSTIVGTDWISTSTFNIATSDLIGDIDLTSQVTGVLPLANGGTAKALTASAGGIVWTDAGSMEVLAGTATAGQILRSGSNVTPSWSTATFAATYADQDLLYASAANVVAGLTKGSNLDVLYVDGAGNLGWTATSTWPDTAIATHAADDDAHHALVTVSGQDYAVLTAQDIAFGKIDDDDLTEVYGLQSFASTTYMGIGTTTLPLVTTMAGLTSIGGQPVAFADAGADAFWGWDDAGGATYENLTDAEAMTIIGGAATDLDANGAVAWANLASGELTSEVLLIGTDVKGGTLTDNKICTWDDGNSQIDCNYTDLQGSGGGLATSTVIADTYMIYGTAWNTVGAEAAFNYDDATDRLTVIYASTTGITATNFWGALTGNADTATAFAGNPAGHCGAGEYGLGIDANGEMESCTDATTEIQSEIAAIDIADLNWANDWMIAYSNGSDLVELTFNDASGKFLMSNGEAALTWEGFTGGTGITENANDFSFDCSEVEGIGIDCAGEAITLAATSTWIWDISDNTNLTAGDALTLTDDDIDFNGGASPSGDLGGSWGTPTVTWGNMAWTEIDDHPSDCAAGQVVSGLADTLTCVATSTWSNTALDLTCTDCINATEIEDIYLHDGASDTMTGTLTCDGVTMGANENLTLGGQTLDHDGTDFVFNDTIEVGANDVKMTNADITGNITNYFSATCNAGEYVVDISDAGTFACTDATTEINSVVNGLGGNDLTCAAQSCDVDDSFLQNDGDASASAYTMTGLWSFSNASTTQLTSGITWITDGSNGIKITPDTTTTTIEAF